MKVAYLEASWSNARGEANSSIRYKEILRSLNNAGNMKCSNDVL